MTNRPHSRKRHSSGKETEVHKRGEGLDQANEREIRDDDEEREERGNPRNPNKPIERGIVSEIIGSAVASGLSNMANNQNQQNHQSQHQQQSPFSNQSPYANNRPSQSAYGGGGNRRGGSGLLRIILLASLFFFILSFLSRGCSSGQQTTTVTPTPTPTPVATSTPEPTPTPTPTPTPVAQANAYPFGSAITNGVTYVNASSNAVNTNVSSGAREKFTQILGNNQDQITMLVYLCGTDLESNYGMATTDLQEMLNATGSDKITIVIQSGGTKQWRNSVMTNGAVERYVIQNGQMAKVNYSTRGAMTDSDMLADFIQWGTQNFPANRYFLDFWDHGGGSLTGYGYDELYPNGSMTVDRIASALEKGGVKFDIVGFDACLMANMETAIAVEPYADYLLASEETEPGTGWYYTDWLSKLAANTSMPSVEIGKNVIDDFCTKTQTGGSSRDMNTLSIVDLAEFKATVPPALSAFSSQMTSAIQNNDYRTVADARSVAKEFASSQKIDQIDLIHFAELVGTSEGKALSQALQDSIKYNRTRNVNNAYGMSIYFPYRNTRKVSSIIQIYKNLSFNDEYAEAVRTFASLTSGAQQVGYSTSNSLFDILGGSPVSNGTSYNSIDLESLLNNGSGYGGYTLLDLLGGTQPQQTPQEVISPDVYDLLNALLSTRSMIDSEHLVLSEKDGQQVLALSNDEWSQVVDIKLNVWVDDGSGYIDLGKDNIFDFNEDGDLIAEYDGQWLAINDQAVHYEMLSDEPTEDGTYLTRGYVPVLLNGEEAHLIVEFFGDNPGEVVGAEKVYEINTQAKLLPINEGDTIDFICDYYNYNGKLDNRYLMGTQITVGSEGLEVSDINVNGKMKFGYVLTDPYGAERHTPMIDYGE
ncbi:MAG: hypothetical protein IJ875_06715 [Solobacterium sp.]|nr:hypothetical protein [Solobacterium sp.]